MIKILIYYFMKKTKFILVFIFFFSFLIFYGCKDNINILVQEKISEVRFNLFSISSDEISINFTSGFRENPYILNGKSENKKEFGVITVKFLKEQENKSTPPNFVITINDMDFDGEFELNPFDQTYCSDIETYVLDDSSIFIKIMWGEYSFEGELKNISKTFNLSSKKALNIFIKEYNKNIKSLIKNNIDFEVYVKIINDPSINLDKYYFYVCLITTHGESMSIIIDPISQEILAKNESKNQVIL